MLTDRRTDRQTDRQTDGQTDRRTRQSNSRFGYTQPAQGLVTRNPPNELTPPTHFQMEDSLSISFYKQFYLRKIDSQVCNSAFLTVINLKTT